MRKGFWKAAIILILLVLVALWAFPSFKQFQCRAKQSEARMGLAQLASSEYFYRGEHQTFAPLSALEGAGLAQFRKQYFRFTTHKTGEKQFELRATGLPKSQVEHDEWSINEKRELKHLREGCTR